MFWPSGKVWPFSVTFEVPANASRASLIFEDHRLVLNLEGDQQQAEGGRAFSPAPVPAASSDAPPGTSGYFLGDEYGIAISGLSRRPNDDLPTWTAVTLDVAIMTLGHHSALGPSIRVGTGLNSGCFLGGLGEQCVRVLWGPDERFEGRVQLAVQPDEGEVSWPRGKGWPVGLVFDVPDGAERGVLLFGEHRIPLDLLGMSGSISRYEYALHYSAASASVLYDHAAKTATLTAVEHDEDTGSIILRFLATNSSEAADFTPLVTAAVARVSEAGEVLDGGDNVEAGWTPVSLSSRGETLAPGQAGEFSLTIPRVGGDGLRLLEFERERPNAVLIQLTTTDAETQAGTRTADSSYVAFQRSSNERRFWLPDLLVTGIRWEPEVPTVGRDVKVTVTVQNQHQTVGAGASALVLQVDGEDVAETTLDALGPGQSIGVEFTWKALDSSSIFGAVVDPRNQVEENVETNNRTTANFGGAFVPDLVVESLTWSPKSPLVGDTLTFTLLVGNQGDLVSGDFRVYVYLDAGTSPTWDLAVAGIGKQQSATITYAWTAQAGTHTFRVVVDGLDELVESTKTNN